MFRATIALVAGLWCSLDCRIASSQVGRSGLSTTHNRRWSEPVNGAADYESIPIGWVVADEEDRRAEQKIRAALSKPISIQMVDQPLSAVAQRISVQVGIPISFDEPALKEAGLSSENSVTINLRGLTARGALGLLLSPLKLTLVHRHDTLQVTTNEAANTMLITRVYPVAELVVTPNGSVDFDSLIGVITATARPQSWDNVGGPGSITGFVGSMALVVGQTREVHEEIEGLLTILRKSRAVQHVAQLELNPLDPSPRDSQETDVERYRPTVRMRSAAGAIAAWQVPRTKDGKPFKLQTTASPPDIHQGFGGGFGGGGFGGGGAGF